MPEQNDLPPKTDATDFERWRDLGNHHAAWDSRNQLIAGLIPEQASVFEFGAGRQALKRYLKPGNTYTPSDLVERGPDTVICDLNASPLPAFPQHDVAVFSGVLEYITDIRGVLRHIRPAFPTVIASYAVLENSPSVSNRRANGWINDYSVQEFINLFTNEGYACNPKVWQWGGQLVFCFRRSE